MPKMDGDCRIETAAGKGQSDSGAAADSQIGGGRQGAGLWISGANYYLTKPFDTKELLAHACVQSPAAGHRPFQADIRLHHTGSFHLHTVLPDGQFPAGKQGIPDVRTLMANPHHIIPAERFLEKIWGYESETEITVVWVYISYLRKKLTALHADIQIQAHRNAGYSLEEAP